MTYSLSEIFEQASKIKTKKDRIEFLQRHRWNVPLAQIFRLAYDKTVVWNLPEGDPPYKPSEYTDSQGMLVKEMRRLYLFLKDQGAPEMTSLKRESLFVGLLESIDSKDAELLLSAKNGKMPYKGLTNAFAREAFPAAFADKPAAPKS